jgi:hypothetical protein
MLLPLAAYAVTRAVNTHILVFFFLFDVHQTLAVGDFNPTLTVLAPSVPLARLTRVRPPPWHLLGLSSRILLSDSGE